MDQGWRRVPYKSIVGCVTGLVYDDGGRRAAGFRGDTRDCVTRAIAIATERDYRDVYDALNVAAQAKRGAAGSARTGLLRTVYQSWLESIGWRWYPTMKIGQGCTVHLRADELPPGRIIARLSGHMCAVIDGIVHDTGDPRRAGTRCVYGYFTQGDQ